MKQFSRIYLFISFIALLLISSCGKKDKTLQENEITFDSIRIEAAQHLFNDASKPNCNLDMTFTFPVKYKNKEVLAKLQEEFIETFLGEKYEELAVEEAISSFKKDYLDDYKNKEKEYLEDQKRDRDTDEAPPTRWYSYYKTGNVGIQYNKANILSCIFFIDSFYGGNNSEKIYTYKTFDLTDGDVLEEEDIFIDDYENELNRLIFEVLATDNKAKTEYELTQMGFFGATELTSNDNFIVDESGITYLYNEREIAAELLGAIKVFLPYEKLRPILKEKSPISPLIH